MANLLLQSLCTAFILNLSWDLILICCVWKVILFLPVRGHLGTFFLHMSVSGDWALKVDFCQYLSPEILMKLACWDDQDSLKKVIDLSVHLYNLLWNEISLHIGFSHSDFMDTPKSMPLLQVKDESFWMQAYVQEKAVFLLWGNPSTKCHTALPSAEAPHLVIWENTCTIKPTLVECI